MKVYQFLFLGHEDKYVKYSRLQTDKMKKKAAAILEELHVKCHAEVFMHELPLSTQKMVEIARAILSVRLESGEDGTTPIIILDEPTGPLNDEERRELFSDLLNMKKNASFFFISHSQFFKFDKHSTHTLRVDECDFLTRSADPGHLV